ncbi:MAG: Por Secre tail protein [Bacteroidota bacterium]|nr:Por Secre tail protein [Bacteroidota bacterium]
MIKNLICIIFIITAFCQICFSQFSLGVNLTDDGAFVNIINHTNRYSKTTGYDSNGWPISDFELVLMDGRPVAEWSGTIDDPEKYRVDYSGIYKCSFSGSADVIVTGLNVFIANKYYDSASNISGFELNIGGYSEVNHGLVFLSFNNTRRSPLDNPKSGITKLKVMKPGYELNSNKIFTDEFINLCKAADFSCYRFYNVQNIWDGEPDYPEKTIWDKRKTPQDACQISMSNLNGKRDGWCWENIIELANILDKDIWINIHSSCDSNYVAKLAELLKSSLKPDINIYVENSNEVWSPSQATHGPYNQAEADYYKITFNQNYARRTVELSKWFAAVFGQEEINKRIKVILAGQQAYNGRSDEHLNYINDSFGEPKKFIYASSTALYFESTNANSTDTALINQGMLDDISAQISSSGSNLYRLNHINKAKSWGLPGGCTSYEGGPGIPAGGGTENLANRILANRTAKMGDVIKYNYLDGWKNIGGGLALYFALASGYNRYGCWGLTDDYTKPDRNFKMQAVRDIINGNTDINENVIGNSKVFIYPNPASDYIYIELPDEQFATTEICSVNINNTIGENLLKSELNLINRKGRLDIPRLPSGLYCLNIYLNNEVYVQGIVVFR